MAKRIRCETPSIQRGGDPATQCPHAAVRLVRSRYLTGGLFPACWRGAGGKETKARRPSTGRYVRRRWSRFAAPRRFSPWMPGAGGPAPAGDGAARRRYEPPRLDAACFMTLRTGPRGISPRSMGSRPMSITRVAKSRTSRSRNCSAASRSAPDASRRESRPNCG